MRREENDCRRWRRFRKYCSVRKKIVFFQAATSVDERETNADELKLILTNKNGRLVSESDDPIPEPSPV